MISRMLRAASSHRALALSVALAGVAAGVAAGSAPAAAALVYGVQATTGNILTIDPTTGAVVNSYKTPAAIATTATRAGLSYAADINQLLYFGESASTLYRLNAATGAVIGTVFGDSFTDSGLNYERSGATDTLFYAHQNDDVHRQSGFGGSTTFFFGAAVPTAGLGGDGYDRFFAVVGTVIDELSLTDGSVLRSFAAPTRAQGLAFDGTSLYVSTLNGLLLTLNPNSGSVLNSVAVAGGNLLELGAQATGITVPEPATLGLLGMAVAGMIAARRKRPNPPYS